MQTLCEFSYAEFASGIEMIQAAKNVKDKKLSRGFIHHAMDEYRHAAVFKCLSEKVDGCSFQAARKYRFLPRLTRSLGYLDPNNFYIERLDLTKFAIFIGTNEMEAMRSFEKRRKVLERYNPEIGIHINNIIKDESRHASYSFSYVDDKPNMLVNLYVIKEKLLNKVRHVYGSNRKISEGIALGILYFTIAVLWPFTFIIRDNRTDRDINLMSHNNGRSLV